MRPLGSDPNLRAPSNLRIHWRLSITCSQYLDIPNFKSSMAAENSSLRLFEMMRVQTLIRMRPIGCIHLQFSINRDKNTSNIYIHSFTPKEHYFSCVHVRNCRSFHEQT